jgi:hypothetical protein
MKINVRAEPRGVCGTRPGPRHFQQEKWSTAKGGNDGDAARDYVPRRGTVEPASRVRRAEVGLLDDPIIGLKQDDLGPWPPGHELREGRPPRCLDEEMRARGRAGLGCHDSAGAAGLMLDRWSGERGGGEEEASGQRDHERSTGSHPDWSFGGKNGGSRAGLANRVTWSLVIYTLLAVSVKLHCLGQNRAAIDSTDHSESPSTEPTRRKVAECAELRGNAGIIGDGDSNAMASL